MDYVLTVHYNPYIHCVEYVQLNKMYSINRVATVDRKSGTITQAWHRVLSHCNSTRLLHNSLCQIKNIKADKEKKTLTATAMKSIALPME